MDYLRWSMIIDCKTISVKIKNDLKRLVQEEGIVPGLAVIIVGDNDASLTYVNNKIKACEEVGFYSETIHLPSNITTEEVIEEIRKTSCRQNVHGIIVQLPLPDGIDVYKVLSSIPPEKDVDCLTFENIGRLSCAKSTFEPCTPKGIMTILRKSGIQLEGANCVIIGRSNIVGKPLAILLTQANATVTLCHSKTKNLTETTRRADIIISAVGKPSFLTPDMVSEKSIVIDVGINRNKSGKLVGDTDFPNIVNKIKAITPVPGGVGVMTVTSLLENTYQAAKNQIRSTK